MKRMNAESVINFQGDLKNETFNEGENVPQR